MEKNLPFYNRRKQAFYRYLTLACTSIIAFNSLTSQASSASKSTNVVNLHGKMIDYLLTPTTTPLSIEFSTENRSQLLRIKVESFENPIERLEFVKEYGNMEPLIISTATKYLADSDLVISTPDALGLIFPVKKSEEGLDYSQPGKGFIEKMGAVVLDYPKLGERFNQVINNEFLRFEIQKKVTGSQAKPILEIVDKKLLAKVLEARIKAKMYVLENTTATPVNKQKKEIFREILKDYELVLKDEEIDALIKGTDLSLITQYSQAINTDPKPLISVKPAKDIRVDNHSPSLGLPPPPPPPPSFGSNLSQNNKNIQINQSSLPYDSILKLNDVIERFIKIIGGKKVPKVEKNTEPRPTPLQNATATKRSNLLSPSVKITKKYKEKKDKLLLPTDGQILSDQAISKIELGLPNILLDIVTKEILNTIKSMSVAEKYAVIEYLTLPKEDLQVEKIIKTALHKEVIPLQQDKYLLEEFANSPQLRIALGFVPQEKNLGFVPLKKEINVDLLLTKVRGVYIDPDPLARALILPEEELDYKRIRANKIVSLPDRISYALENKLPNEDIQKISEEVISSFATNRISPKEKERLLFPPVAPKESTLDYSKIGEGFIKDLAPHLSDSRLKTEAQQFLNKNFLQIILRNELGLEVQKKIISSIDDKKQLLEVISVIADVRLQAIGEHTKEKDFIASITRSLKAISPDIMPEEVQTFIKNSNNDFLLPSYVKSINNFTTSSLLVSLPSASPSSLPVGVGSPIPHAPPLQPLSVQTDSIFRLVINNKGPLEEAINQKLSQIERRKRERQKVNNPSVDKAADEIKPITDIGKKYQKLVHSKKPMELLNSDYINHLMLEALIVKLTSDFSESTLPEIVFALKDSETEISKAADIINNNLLEEITTDPYLKKHLPQTAYKSLGVTLEAKARPALTPLVKKEIGILDEISELPKIPAFNESPEEEKSSTSSINLASSDTTTTSPSINDERNNDDASTMVRKKKQEELVIEDTKAQELVNVTAESNYENDNSNIDDASTMVRGKEKEELVIETTKTQEPVNATAKLNHENDDSNIDDASTMAGDNEADNTDFEETDQPELKPVKIEELGAITVEPEALVQTTTFENLKITKQTTNSGTENEDDATLQAESEEEEEQEEEQSKLVNSETISQKEVILNTNEDIEEVPIKTQAIHLDSPLIFEEFKQLPEEQQQKLLSSLTGSTIFAHPALFNSVNDHIYARTISVAAGDEDNKYIKGLWVSGIYGASQQGTKAKVTGYKSNSAGWSIGFDVEFDDKLVGVAYSNLRSNFKARPSKINSKIAVESHIFSLYGRKELVENLTMQGAFSVLRSNISTKASTAQGNILILNSKYNNTSYNFDVKLNYLMTTQSGLTIVPNIGINYGSYKDDSYTDNTLAIQNLSVAAKSHQLLSCSIGTRVTLPKQISEFITLTPSLHTDIIKNINSKRVQTKLSQNGNIIANDITIPRDSDLGYNLGAALLVERKNIKLQMEYNCKLQKKYQSHQGMLKLKISF